MNQSLRPDYFDGVYSAKRDPWDFETSLYEAAKYDETLDILPEPHYSSALEIGCSIGVLTARLAPRCGRLLAIDVSPIALDQARRRCAAHPNVQFEQREVPRSFPPGSFDLVLVSEVAYYWSPRDQTKAMDLIAAQQPAGATLLLVHFTPVVHDYPQTGDAVHQAWLKRPEWRHLEGHRRDRYRIDLLVRQAHPA